MRRIQFIGKTSQNDNEWQKTARQLLRSDAGEGFFEAALAELKRYSREECEIPRWERSRERHHEDESYWYLSVPLPGLDTSRLSYETHDGFLKLKGVRSDKIPGESCPRELEFRRLLPLPVPISEDDIRAVYVQETLVLVFTKKEV